MEWAEKHFQKVSLATLVVDKIKGRRLRPCRIQCHNKSEGAVPRTSTSMRFPPVAAPSPTIFRLLYLFARRRKSWNWANWEVQGKPFALQSGKKRQSEMTCAHGTDRLHEYGGLFNIVNFIIV